MLPVVYLASYIAIISLLGALTYFVIAYKMGILDKIFGRSYLNKIIKKLTFGKISLN